MFYAKMHEGNNSSITAVCDEDIIGKIYREKNKVLNISEGFYKGRLVSEDELKAIFKKSININIVGKNCINLAIREGIADKNSVIYIKGIPFMQVYYI